MLPDLKFSIKHTLIKTILILLGGLMMTTAISDPAFADSNISKEVTLLLEKVSTINSESDEKEKESSLEALLKDCEKYLEQHQDQAEAWVLAAMVRSSYARTQGFKALSAMKQVRKEIEQAIELNPSVMRGFAHSFLGRLYYTVPGWPASYGSDKDALTSIQASLAINNDSKENQYYHGMYWLKQKDYGQAILHLQLAKNSQSFSDSPIWIENMNKQIEDSLLIAKESKR